MLRFTGDGAALLSGGDDSAVSVWSVSRSIGPSHISLIRTNLSLSRRLVSNEFQAELPVPYCSLSDHTLPVTDIICGVGAFPKCRILTSSIDHSVKVSWRFLVL